MDRVEFLEQFQTGLLDLGLGARGGLKVEDRWTAPGVEGDSLMLRGQESAGPVKRASGGIGDAASVGQDHEAGEALVLGSQAVRQPGPHRWEAHLAETGVRLEDSGDVVGRLGDHRLDHGQLVGHFRDLGEQVGDPQAALAPPFEGVMRLVETSDLAAEDIGHADALRHLATVEFLQVGLVVERIDVAQAASEEDMDDLLGPGLMMQAGTTGSVGGLELSIAEQQVGGGHGVQTEDGVAQEIPAGRLDRPPRIVLIHGLRPR